MKIKTRIAFKEYAKLLYSLAYEKPVLKLLVSVAALIVLWIICYYLDIFQLPKPVIYQYSALILIVVVQPLLIYFAIRKNYKSSSHISEAMEMELTRDEIMITGESFYLEVKWEKMFKIVERTNFFLVYQNSLSAIIIPKKDLGPDGVGKLREIFSALKKTKVNLKDS